LRPRGQRCRPGELLRDFVWTKLRAEPVRGDEHGLDRP